MRNVFFLSCVCTALFAEPKIVVVGGGIAGLTAAYRLHQQGIDVEVYEARGRVGGRILSAEVGGKMAELGGQNIADGGEANHLHRLIDEFGLELVSDQVELNQYYFMGDSLHLVKRDFDHEQMRAQLNEAAQKSPNMAGVIDSLFAPDDPHSKVIQIQLATYEGGNVKDLSSLYIETMYRMLMGGLSNAHAHRKIALSSIREGNSRLPQKMAEALGDRIHLNHPLTAVSKAPDGRYLLSFQNGEETHTDLLILAIPSSIYSDISFEAGLIPEERLDAIRQIQYGTNAKILIPMSQIPPKRTSLVNDRSISFFNAERTILTVYYAGEAAKFSPDTIQETFENEKPMIEMGLQGFVPPLASVVCAEDIPFVSYEGTVGHSWPNDPYAKGSYSYIAAGQEKAMLATHEIDGEEVKTLFAPIAKSLYFAGEHASTLSDVPGTMEAACESGERVARLILKQLEIKSSANR